MSARLSTSALYGTVLDNLTTPASHDFVQQALADELRAKLEQMLARSQHAELVGLVRAMDPIDVAASADLPAWSVLAQHAAAMVADGAAWRPTVAAGLEIPGSTTTVRELLGLDKPIRDDPLFWTDVYKSALTAILATSPVLSSDPALIDEIVELYASESNPSAQFWDELARTSGFDAPGVLQAIQASLQLGSLTGNNPVAVQAIRARAPNASLRDLGAWQLQDWQTALGPRLDDGTLSIGRGIAGDSPLERLHNYIDEMMHQLASRFPTDHIARGLAQDRTLDPSGAVAQYLQSASDFDFRTTHVDRFLATKPAGLAAALEPTPVGDNLKRLQRVFQVAPRYEHMQALLGAGIHSAHQIVSQPRESFVRSFQASMGGEAVARQTYARAELVHAATVQVFTQLAQGVKAVQPRAMASATPALDQLPDLAALFGPLNLCDCAECHSVYGQAAYLVDLLYRLSGPKVTGGASVLDVLLARRPDLEFIKLTCENTNTQLPYVDLVNEILETYVVLGQLDKSVAHDNGATTTAELNAEPTYTNPAAYDTLRQAVFPNTLPYNWPLAIARAHLGGLGSSRFELMQTVRQDTVPSPLDLALEYLGIGPDERDILTGVSTRPLADFFYDTAHQPADLVGSLAPARTFLTQTGLTYPELVLLLETNYVNPLNELSLDAPATADPCDLDQTTVKGLDQGTLGRIHRFIRLWRRVGGSMLDLDKAIRVAGITPVSVGSDISADLLTGMADVKLLQSELGSTLLELLSLWANIDTRGSDSLYNQLFLNRGVLSPNDPNDPGKDFLPNPDGSVLTDATKTLSTHAAQLCAAFQATFADLALARLDAGLASDSAILSLANVSAVHRYKVLARGLKITVGELIDLKVLVGPAANPFGTPALTRQFVDVVRTVHGSKFSVADFDYLYRHVVSPSGGPAPPLGDMLTLTRTLHSLLANVAATYASASDPTGDLTRARLGEALDEAVVAGTMQLLDGSAASAVHFDTAVALTIPPDLAARLSYDRAAKLLRLNGSLSTPDRTNALTNIQPASLAADPTYQAAIGTLFQQPRTFIASQLSAFLNAADAATALLEPAQTGQMPTPPQEYAYILARLLPYLAARRSDGIISQALSTALGLGPQVLDVLLKRLHAGTLLQRLEKLAVQGLAATYFSDPALTTVSLERIDAQLSFDPATNPGSPAGVGSVRWTASFTPPDSASYQFFVQAVGAVQLWVGDAAAPVINVAVGAATTTEAASDPVQLVTGQLYRIRLELRQVPQQLHVALAQLRWSGGSTPKQVLPSSNLYPGDQVEVLTLLHKSAAIVNQFGLTDLELTYLLDHAADFGAFDLQSLPFVRGDPTATDQLASGFFQQWQRLDAYVSLRDDLPPSNTALIDVFAASAAVASLPPADPRLPAAISDLRLTILAATGWNAAVFDDLTGAGGLNLHPEAYRNDVALARVWRALELAERLGVAPHQLVSWAATVPTTAQALEIKRTVKSLYDSQTWFTLAKGVSDELRESQRDALVAYLLPRTALPDANALFERFLIDAEMGACMPTSRINQAIASVQLFVQRCQMNLEPAVPPTSIDPDFWQWMKHYRVWQANRKVFLYPENWIEPELRPEQSTFFRELQTELLQSDLTPDAIEAAFLHYLEKLNQVARLEICGSYWQNETTPTGQTLDILHVFGRTYATPHIYYYRQLRNRAAWTPWERIDLDIVGDHLLPVMFNRRLHLFWPVFTPKVSPDQPISDQNKQGTPPQRYWEINLAWSEYRQGKWQTKQLSTGPDGFLSTKNARVFISWGSDDADRRKYIFTTLIVDDPDSATGHRTGVDQKLQIVCQWNNPDPVVSDPNTGRQTLALLDIGQFELTASGKITAFALGGAQHMVRVPTLTSFDALGMASVASGSGTPQLLLSSMAEQRPVLTFGSIPSAYRIHYPHQFAGDFTIEGPAPHNYQPFFYQDKGRTYFVMPTSVQESVGIRVEMPVAAHFHPYVWTFVRELNARGIAGMFALDTQRPADRGWLFHDQYKPTYRVPLPYPEETVEFDPGGAYTLYNWELFFHAPLLIASRLSKNQQFDAARAWFHHIFDPTNPDATAQPADRTSAEWARERYWKFLPFQLYEWDRIFDLLDALGYSGTDAQQLAFKNQVVDQVSQWLANPFNPHEIAALRQVAYQKSVFMRYLDNLIAQGDQLFRQYTPETVQEATQLYVLASDLLGPRPERVPPRGTVQPETYNSLKPNLDAFSNALVALENQFPFSTSAHVSGHTAPSGVSSVTVGQSLYFGIPQNDRLLGYWDTVASRLDNIRHCRNIEGVVGPPQMPPAINPAALVAAAAMGLDLSSALSDIAAPTPYYRFPYVLQKAQELCGDLKGLGAALLAALEKRDAEALALLRSGQEIQLLNAARMVKEHQVDEANRSLQGLQASRLVAQERYDFYSGVAQRNDYETEQVKQLGSAQDFQIASQVTSVAAGVAHALPDFDIGISGPMGSPVAKLKYGGTNIGSSLQVASGVLSLIASLHSHQANMASIQGGWARRSDDWGFQARLAQRDLDQIDKQILAAQARVDISQQELKNHDQQIDNAKATDDYMRHKYTNQELYDWTAAQVSAVYFQTYQTAYDLAKRAERAFQFDRGITTSSFIQFGYWDNLRKGLLAGEQLSLALRQLESAYFDQNKREYELTRHVSLLLHDPLALISLKETGRCYVSLPEAVFDVDYPGHFMRRLRNVSLTIPCVVGPYTSINCTLTLLGNRIRASADAQVDYPEQDSDNRFIYNFASTQSIATSHAQNDSGLFEVNFHDERYLPFEGAGAVSEWRIDLPRECNAFDFATISDVILKVSYTAREGGDQLRTKAWTAAVMPPAHAQAAPPSLGASPAQDNLVRMYSVKHEFPNDWYRFLQPPDTAAGQSLSLNLTQDRFPFQLRNRTLTLGRIELFLKLSSDALTDTYRTKGAPLTLSVTPPGGTAVNGALASQPAFLNGVPHVAVDVGPAGLGTWAIAAAEADIANIAADLRHTITVDTTSHQRINANAVEDLVMVCHLSAH